MCIRDRYRTELFVIDQTPPKLVFSDVADQSANNGEVRPALRYSDANYDPDGTEILLSGYRNGQMEWKGSWRQLENGMALKDVYKRQRKRRSKTM